MSSYHETGAREVSEYEVMKEAHFPIYIILRFMMERGKDSAKRANIK